MPTEVPALPPGAALHLLMAWSAASYPTGAFSFSHGLETEISTGRAHDPDSLTLWLDGVLRYGAGHSDAALLTRAYHAQGGGQAPETEQPPDTQPADLGAVADLAAALAPSAERLLETSETGRAFAAVTARIVPGAPGKPQPFPVAFGAAACAAAVPLADAARAYLHGFGANLVSAAQRFMPMGQTDGQRVMVALYPVMDAVAAQATADPRLGSAALTADLAAMEHETLPTRIFRS